MVMLGPGDLGVKHTESLLSQSVRCTEVMEKESLQERRGDIMGAFGGQGQAVKEVTP